MIPKLPMSGKIGSQSRHYTVAEIVVGSSEVESGNITMHGLNLSSIPNFE
jgi:hypothetical protein